MTYWSKSQVTQNAEAVKHHFQVTLYLLGDETTERLDGIVENTMRVWIPLPGSGSGYLYFNTRPRHQCLEEVT